MKAIIANKTLFMKNIINLCVHMGAGVRVLFIEWTKFCVPDSDKDAEGMSGKVLFDVGNLYCGETPVGIRF